MPDKSTTDWTEERHDALDLTIRWKAQSHSLTFAAKGGVRQDDRTVSYAMGDSACPRSDDFDDGENLVHGFIKWDGCSHVYFGDHENYGYLHLCGGRYFAQLDFILRRVWQLASEKVGLDQCAHAELFTPATNG